MACIYILFSSSSNKFSIGPTHNNSPDTRLSAHNKGKTRSTKAGRPWVLIHKENYIDYTEARKREFFLKSGVGRKWVNENFGHHKNNY